eukprot:CAMPEP_0114113784 /NCGR_PEP_ID=MMETSP0043_2-20121206/3097_1 /TAXON_ID=464988 /ORGANISM="Hemiselmis andersenii, Strain CCMP644" /LENGTH=83 /DNA_ID=CAMNT_0001205957 /DNA_START=109 /DNA_END=360 /DNA_ORIENTATION=-
MTALTFSSWMPWHAKKYEFYVITEYIKANPSLFGEDMGSILALLASGHLRPKVTELPLERAGEALAMLDDRKACGKVVLKPWG